MTRLTASPSPYHGRGNSKACVAARILGRPTAPTASRKQWLRWCWSRGRSAFSMTTPMGTSPGAGRWTRWPKRGIPETAGLVTDPVTKTRETPPERPFPGAVSLVAGQDLNPATSGL